MSASQVTRAPSAAEAIEVRRPVDGSLLATVAVDDPGRVREAVGRARAAQPAWEALGVSGRRRWLDAFRDWLVDREAAVGDLMQAETGKVRAEVDTETAILPAVAKFYGRNAHRFLADETPAPSPLMRTRRLRVVHRPHQVVGVIGAWNYPLFLTIGDAIPALLAGCAVVIKPSEVTPLCTTEAVRGWREDVGAPPVLDVVNGAGPTGAALVDECDFVQFTGSEQTGRLVMKRAAETLTPVSLELGGKDPMIVLRDADLERASAAAAWGGLLNAGQTCLSIERVYVESPVYEDFVARLADRVRGLRQGPDGRGYDADVGPMTAPGQIEVVEAHVRDARERGARIVCGGRRRAEAGDWYEPTVIADADHTMTVMREETFGPVIPVMRVADADEAVRLANDSGYGLAASVFTADPARGERIARRLDVGGCNVNDVLIHAFNLEVPMGGWKQSGIGYRHGAYGIRKYCRAESIVAPRISRVPRSEPLWYPYTPRRRRLLRRLGRLVNARGTRRRLGL
jgi:betaine-aldehyde dehydrogenase